MNSDLNMSHGKMSYFGIFFKKGISCQIKNLAQFFICLTSIFWHYYRNGFELKKFFLMILTYIESFILEGP